MKKLRNYKGVTYDPARNGWVTQGNWTHYFSAAAVITSLPFLDDDDHAELMRLRADPYESVPTLEDVVRNWVEDSRHFTRPFISDLCYRLRQAFPHIDGEGT